MNIATYTYKYKVGAYPFHEWVPHTLKVEILDDTGKRIKVKFLGYHADGRTPGTISKVERKSLTSSASRSGKSIDLAHIIEKQNLDSELIRKPYKDD